MQGCTQPCRVAGSHAHSHAGLQAAMPASAMPRHDHPPGRGFGPMHSANHSCAPQPTSMPLLDPNHLNTIAMRCQQHHSQRLLLHQAGSQNWASCRHMRSTARNTALKRHPSQPETKLSLAAAGWAVASSQQLRGTSAGHCTRQLHLPQPVSKAALAPPHNLSSRPPSNHLQQAQQAQQAGSPPGPCPNSQPCPLPSYTPRSSHLTSTPPLPPHLPATDLYKLMYLPAGSPQPMSLRILALLSSAHHSGLVLKSEIALSKAPYRLPSSWPSNA
jgi:hypothetical protein